MILGYRDRRTAQFAAGRRVPAFQGFARQAYKRLEILDAAASLVIAQVSLAFGSMPQWRLCFEWPRGAAGPSAVEIVGYH